MNEYKQDYIPIGKRTRLQRSLREKEYFEKNKRTRATTRRKQGKGNIYGEKYYQDCRGDSSDEDIKVVDKAEYFRLVYGIITKNSSPNVDVSFEGENDDFVYIVEEKLDSLGVGTHDNKETGVGSYGEGNDSGDCQSLIVAVIDGGVGDGHQSPVVDQGIKGGVSDQSAEVDLDIDGRVGKGCHSPIVYQGSDGGFGKGCQSSGMELGVDGAVGYQSAEVDQDIDGGIGSQSPIVYQCTHDAVGNDSQSSGKELAVCDYVGYQSAEVYLNIDGGIGNQSPRMNLSIDGGAHDGAVGDGFQSAEASGMEPAVDDDVGYQSAEVDLNTDGDVGSESPRMNPGIDGGALGGAQSSPIVENDPYSDTSSEDDDHNASDEDFNADEADLCTNFSSEYSSSDDSEEDVKCKKGSYSKDGEVVRGNVGIYDNCMKKIKERTYEEGVQWVVDDKMVVRSVEPENDPMPENFCGSEKGSLIPSSSLCHCTDFQYGGCRERGRPPKSKCAGIESDLENSLVRENCSNFENVGNRKRCMPPKNNNEAINSTPQVKKRIRKLKPHEAENIMMNTILENGNAGLGSSVHTVATTETSTSLPLKFRYGYQSSLPVISEEMHDSESLFQDLGFALRACDIGTEISFLDENDDNNPSDKAVLQEQLCLGGKHDIIHEEEIGIRCKYCSFVKLEIRHITPEFNKNPFGRSENRNYGQLAYDNVNASNGCRLPDFNDDHQNARLSNIQGTVWALIPGIRETLYPHQQEGFEFMWRNVGGGINLDQLGKPTKFGYGGCIICHAPGTGKTRLAITFLQSFIRQYPMSKPVIVAPKSMLLTWEEEFVRWNIDVPFINMNKTELSGDEDPEVLNHVENGKHQKTVRIAKIYTWAMGKGILGISYTLFEKLAGDRKGVDKKIRQVLLEKPGVLILDEGHTPRNDQSNIWNVLNEVQTKRRIILSGTPFQNNFEELLNTLSLVREEFGSSLLPGKYMKNCRNLTGRRRGLMNSNVESDRRITKLKNGMKPFVHVHKGEILKKTLRGLFHSVVLLKPSDLQRTCFQHLSGLKNGLKLDHLVSIASVHPYLLHSCEEFPAPGRDLLMNHRRNMNAGVKIRFLFDLINLAQGEKVLVFSQFIKPLTYIRKLLKSRYHWTEENELLYMDGKQDVKQRQTYIRHFNDPKSEARVLLASTKACCEGIHLVGASRVVLLDVVWNPSVERQAISRAYRLGQQKDVFVYHLITSGTQEEEKYYWQVTKDRVSEKVFSCEEEVKANVGMPTMISEDRILEAMVQNEKIKNIFSKIIYQPKADEFIESFGPVNL